MCPAAEHGHPERPLGGGDDGGDDPRLLEIASAIADGDTLDWPELESGAASDRDRALLREMGALAEIAAANRRILEEQVEAPARPIIDGVSLPSPGQPVPESWGPLEIIEKIGEGVFGEVYRARDTRLATEVALKLQRPGKTASRAPDTTVIEEGRLLARVRHENVASVYGAECHDDRVGIWMELIPGQTLEELVAAQGTLGAEEATSIGRQLCRALAAIHQAGVLHRDLKARNVMRREGGRIVLMDLGTGSDIPAATERGPSTTAGTPLYMAPETLLRHEASVQSDIYSLGVLLYYLVTGTYPVSGKTIEDLCHAHARGESARLLDRRADLPMEFICVVERALSADPAERFTSAGQLEQALTDALGPAPDAADAPGPEPGPDSASRQAQPLASPPGPATAVPATSWWKRLAEPLGRRPLPALAGLAAAVVLFLIITQLVPISTYSVEAALYRDLDQAAGESDELLLPGASLELGDRLYLAVEATRDLFVYVISEDDAAASYLLFPNPAFAQENPIPAGRRSLLPGPSRDSGKQLSWEVTSTGGREHILVIASPRRLDDLEAEIEHLARPSHDGPQTQQYQRLPEGTLHQLRGIGGLVESSPPASAEGAPPRRLADLVKRYEPGQESLRGDQVWMRQIELNYPPR